MVVEGPCFRWRYRGLLGPREWGGVGDVAGITAAATVHSVADERVIYSANDDNWIWANGFENPSGESLYVTDLNGVDEYVYETPYAEATDGSGPQARYIYGLIVGPDDNVYVLTEWTDYHYNGPPTYDYSYYESVVELIRFDTSVLNDPGTVLMEYRESGESTIGSALEGGSLHAGPDGNLYYASRYLGQVNRITWGTWAHEVLVQRTPYTTGLYQGGPDQVYSGIAVANDGGVWFTHGQHATESGGFQGPPVQVTLARWDPITETVTDGPLTWSWDICPFVDGDSGILLMEDDPNNSPNDENYAYHPVYEHTWNGSAIVSTERTDFWLPKPLAYWFNTIDGTTMVFDAGWLYEADFDCGSQAEPEFLGYTGWWSAFSSISLDGQWIYGVDGSINDRIFRHPPDDHTAIETVAAYTDFSVGEIAVGPDGTVLVVAVANVGPGGNNRYRIDRIQPGGTVDTVYGPMATTNDIIKLARRVDKPTHCYVLVTDDNDSYGDFDILDMEIATGAWTYVDTQGFFDPIAGYNWYALDFVSPVPTDDGAIWFTTQDPGEDFAYTDYGGSLAVWRWDPTTHALEKVEFLGGMDHGGDNGESGPFYQMLVPQYGGKVGIQLKDNYWHGSNTPVVGAIIGYENGEFTLTYERGLNEFPTRPETGDWRWNTIDQPPFGGTSDWVKRNCIESVSVAGDYAYFTTDGEFDQNGGYGRAIWRWPLQVCTSGRQMRVSAAVSFSYPDDVDGVYWDNGYYMLHLIGVDNLGNPEHLSSLGSADFSAVTGYIWPEWGPGSEVDYIALPGQNAWKGNYLIVGNHTNPGWFVVDCSDPYNPFIAHHETFAVLNPAEPYYADIDPENDHFPGGEFVVEGDYVYFTGGGELIIYYIGVPTSPVLMSITELPVLVGGHPHLVNNYLIIPQTNDIVGYADVWVYDVSDRGNPVLVDTLDTWANQFGFMGSIAGNLLWLRYDDSLTGEDRVFSVDITDPTNLVANEHLIVPGSSEFGDISAHGDLLLVPDGSGGTTGLQAFDTISGTVLESDLGPNGRLRYAWDHSSEILDDRYRIVISSGFNGSLYYLVLDVDETGFEVAGYVDLPVLTDDGDTYTNGTTTTQYICVPDNCWNWIDRGVLPEGGDFGVVTPSTINAVAAVVNGDYGWYEIMDDYRCMQLVDFAVPEHPRLRGFITLRQVIDAAIEPRLYYGYYDNTDPTDAYFNYTFYAGAWSGSTFYMAAWDGSWDENFIVDCSDLDNPVIVATHKTGGTINAAEPLGVYGMYTTAVAIDGTTLILGGSATQFRDPDMQQGAKAIAKYDITDITNPVYVDHIHWEGQQGRFSSVVIDGGVAYAVATGWPNGFTGPDTGSLPSVHSIDIATWTLLDTVDIYATVGGTNDLGEAVLIGTELHVKSNRAGVGVTVIDVSNPSNMVVVDGYGVADTSYNMVDLVDDKVLAATATYGHTALFDPSIVAYDDSLGGIVAGSVDNYFNEGTLPTTPGYPNFEGGQNNLGYRSLGDGEHVFTQMWGSNGSPDYNRTIWGFFVFKIGDTKPVAPNRWEHVGTAIMADYHDSDPAWATGEPYALMEYPANAHVTNYDFAQGTDTGRKVFYTNIQDNAIYSVNYPSMTPADTQDGGGWFYSYLADAGDGASYRYGWGLALAGTKLYFLVERSSIFPSRPSGAEIWEFDTTNPDDPGTIVYEDDDELGGGSGTMRGHMVYNPADDRIYIAEGYGYSDTTPFVEYHTSLVAIDRTTWTREELATFSLATTTPPHLTEYSITLTGERLIWFMTHTEVGVAEFINVYDTVTGATASVEMAPFNFIQDPYPMSHNSVLVWDEDEPIRFTFDGVEITSERFPAATLIQTGAWSGPYWYSTFTPDGSGTAGETFALDGDHLWVHNTSCADCGQYAYLGIHSTPCG